MINKLIFCAILPFAISSCAISSTSSLVKSPRAFDPDCAAAADRESAEEGPRVGPCSVITMREDPEKYAKLCVKEKPVYYSSIEEVDKKLKAALFSRYMGHQKYTEFRVIGFEPLSEDASMEVFYGEVSRVVGEISKDYPFLEFRLDTDSKSTYPFLNYMTTLQSYAEGVINRKPARGNMHNLYLAVFHKKDTKAFKQLSE